MTIKNIVFVINQYNKNETDIYSFYLPNRGVTYSTTNLNLKKNSQRNNGIELKKILLLLYISYKYVTEKAFYTNKRTNETSECSYLIVFKQRVNLQGVAMKQHWQ